MSEIAPKTPRGTDLGLYVHVPFCATTCDFCAFYQEKPSPERIRDYLDGIDREIGLVEWDAPITTLFWGGGTPGLLAADDLRRLGEKMHRVVGSALREWTVEMAPSSVSEARLQALKEIGVTRISMGVQSFRPELLEALGRRHERPRTMKAYAQIKEAGFASVNLDLMFALPGQEEEEWLADLQEALALCPDHLSTYCLTFEEDTALWVKLSQGKVKLDPEREARLYERTWRELAAAGYPQYEISNFARPGHACIHNVNTWRMQEWVGLGPSGSSQHAGWRGTNVADLVQWRAGLEAGRRAVDDRSATTPSLLAEDALIFGLRMNEGVDLGELRARFPAAPWPAVEPLLERLVAEGRAVRAGGRVSLTLPGRMVADAVGAELLGAMQETSLP